jgi:hypothetical protein
MLDGFFVPSLVVHHRRRIPQPILPVPYGFFLAVRLPEDTTSWSLMEQLMVAKTATIWRRRYPFTGPFGPIVAFEYRVTDRCSIYLNPEGDFA